MEPYSAKQSQSVRSIPRLSGGRKPAGKIERKSKVPAIFLGFLLTMGVVIRTFLDFASVVIVNS